MSSFAFIPRKVAAKVQNKSTKSSDYASSSTPATSSCLSESKPPKTTSNPHVDASVLTDIVEKGKGKALPVSDQDLARLLMVSLSEHALWADEELRSFFEVDEGDAFVPLSYLLQRSQVLGSVSPPPSEATVVQAIRGHGSDVLEVRMLLTEAPDPARWFAERRKKGAVGGYEVRRKDWKSVLHRVKTSTSSYWDQRTVYLENISIAHRSLYSTLDLVTSLLPASSPNSRATTSKTTSNVPRIQYIVFPLHHADPPNAPMPVQSKGFAFVTLADSGDANYLIEAWPWDRPPAHSSDTKEIKGEGDGAELDLDAIALAKKTGLRALSKARWDQLKEEYLAYQQRLLQLSASAASRFTETPTISNGPPEDYDDASSELPRKRARVDAPPPTHAYDDASASSELYPPNVLLFVRHLHPDTNKTTLRTLFTTALENAGVAGGEAAKAIDYVDFTKGMDSCHLRMVTPLHAKSLVDHFAARFVVQTRGLADGSSASAVPGSTSSSSLAAVTGHPISIELVTGTKEALYWERVPHTVRQTAMQKVASYARPIPSDQDTRDNGNLHADEQSRRNPIERGGNTPSSSHIPPLAEHRWLQGSKVAGLATSYPTDVLLFVRNVHPDTNKTTLRRLFSQALVACGEDLGPTAAEKAVDYVDYSKGLDFCHLRMSTPTFANSLLDYFATHTVIQTDGLDQVGNHLPSAGSPAPPAPPGTTNQPLMLESVIGTREALYWEKVPEKVKIAALARATNSGSPGAGDAIESGMAGGAARKRKRGKGASGRSWRPSFMQPSAFEDA